MGEEDKNIGSEQMNQCQVASKFPSSVIHFILSDSQGVWCGEVMGVIQIQSQKNKKWL